MRALLHVNVLSALRDAAHVLYASPHAWVEANIDHGWTSCPLTQIGCIRILSQPAYAGSRLPGAIAVRLADAAGTRWHAFWHDDLSLLELVCVDWHDAPGSRQLTGVYLLALAVRRSGRLVTFDRAVPLAAVRNANRAHLEST